MEIEIYYLTLVLKLANIASYNAFVALAVDRTTETKAVLLLKLRPVKAGKLKP